MDADRARGRAGRDPSEVRPDGSDGGMLLGEHEDREGCVEPARRPAMEGVVGVHSRRPSSYGRQSQGRATNLLMKRRQRWNSLASCGYIYTYIHARSFVYGFYTTVGFQRCKQFDS